MTEKTTFIPARLKSSVLGGHVAGASDIIDDEKDKTQDVINKETDDSIADINKALEDMGNKEQRETEALNKKIDQNKQDADKEFEDIKKELATKQATLEFDNAPAEGSNNPVKSDGIKKALNEKQDKVAGKGLSTEDYTTDEKKKLSDLPNNSELQQAIGSKQDNLTFDNVPTDGSANPVRSGGIKTAIDSEASRAKAAEDVNKQGIEDINSKIPTDASADNQLADKAFVNSSVATNTANYISNGWEPFESIESLNAYTGVLTNNDYAFVKDTDESGNALFKRYKYSAATKAWALEFVLNNSSFTQSQWNAINSGITTLLTQKLDKLPTLDELKAILLLKQDVIQDLDTIRTNAQKGSEAYQKPATGIPSSDMSQEVRESLGKANSALQAESLDAYYNKEKVDELLDGKQDNMTIDLTPTVNSNNPISSDAVYNLQQALSSKQNVLTFDLTPTAGSGNPVTSSGVFAAIAEAGQIQFETVEELPQPDATTMGKIYVMGHRESFKWYVTKIDSSSDPVQYLWKQVSNNSVDLSDYYNISQVDTLFRALAKVASTGKFEDLLEKPTTLQGYGITDAYTKEEVYTRKEVGEKLASIIDSIAVDDSNGDISVEYDI